MVFVMEGLTLALVGWFGPAMPDESAGRRSIGAIPPLAPGWNPLSAPRMGHPAIAAFVYLCRASLSVLLQKFRSNMWGSRPNGPGGANQSPVRRVWYAGPDAQAGGDPTSGAPLLIPTGPNRSETLRAVISRRSGHSGWGAAPGNCRHPWTTPAAECPCLRARHAPRWLRSQHWLQACG